MTWIVSFHPLLGHLDSGEPLAALLRAGNAGSNTARDHFDVLGRALELIRDSELDREILARADAGGATHAFTGLPREDRLLGRLRAQPAAARGDPRAA